MMTRGCERIARNSLLRSGFHLSMVVVLTVSLLGGETQQALGSDWQEFSGQLEGRRLYRLAAVFLDQQMVSHAQDTLTLRELVIRRSHIETAWAIESSPDSREAHWAQAQQIIEDGRAQFQDPQSELLLDVQAALTQLALAQTLREDDEWAARRDTATQARALAALRSAVELLQQVERSAPQLMSDPNARYPDPWKAERWISVQRGARFHQAKAAFERAYWYQGEDRLNRVEALQAAQEELQDVSQQVGSEEPLWWQVQLARVQAARQLEDWQAAQQVLQAAQLAEAPLDIRPQWIAEIVRVENGLKRAENADRLAAAILQGQFGSSAEPQMAVLELLLDRWQESGKQAYQTQAVALAGEIEKRQGLYWGRRANRLLVNRSIDPGQPPQNLDVLIRIADETFLKGDWKESLVTYDRAIDLARTSSQISQAAQLLARTGAVYQVAGEFAKAVDRFDRAADLTDDDIAAGEFAWLAITNAKAASQGANLAEASDYRNRIVEFLATYKDHPRQAEVWLALAVVEYQQSRLAESVAAAMSVPATAPQFLDATNLVQLVVDRLERVVPETADPLLSEVQQVIEPTLFAATDEIRPPVSPQSIAAAVLWSRLELRKPQPARARIADLLQRHLAESPDETVAPWRERAVMLVIVALAGLPQRHEQVPPYLDQLTGQAGEELVAALESLQRIVPTLPAKDQEQVALWQLQLLQRERPDQTAEDSPLKLRFATVTAWAQLYSGDPGAAVTTLRQYAKQRPNDGGVQQNLAEVLTQAGEDYRDQAIEQWRLLGSRSQARTDRWFLSKYWVIRLTAEAGDRERAATLLKYLKTVPPGWNDSPFAPQFDQLAKVLLRE